MCGGIVVAYSASKVDENFSKSRAFISHLLYGLGRVSTYSLMGAVFGLLGSVVAFDSTMRSSLFMITGVLMILVGFSLVGKLPFLNAIEHSVMNRGWFKSLFTKLIREKNYISFYYLGVLNGLIPCGLVYFFAISAASSASPLLGASVMAIFGLSTIPALFMLGYTVGVLKRYNFRDMLMKISSVAVILFGIYTFIKGFNSF